MTLPCSDPSSAYAVMGSIWIVCDGHAFLGRGRVSLLEEIDITGSISQAARHMGMSYKKAWRLVQEMNTLAEEPLVVRTSGGAGGGGTMLTRKGREMIATFRAIDEQYRAFLDGVMRRTRL